MSSLQSLTGNWYGNFGYGPEYEIVDQEKPRNVTFSMELSDNNGSFTGTCVDDEVKNIMKGVITVIGFVEGDIISFTKQYPCSYFSDENGHIQLDYSQPHPPIIYSGVYDAESNSYSGDWEMTTATENINGECFDEIFSGAWTISRVADSLN